MKKLIVTMICLVMLSAAAPAIAENCLLSEGAKVVVIMQNGKWMKGLHPQTIWVQTLRRVDKKEIADLKQYTGFDWSKGKLVTFGIAKKDNPEVVQEVFIYAHPAGLSNCQ